MDDFIEAVQRAVGSMMEGVNTSMPGRIVSYDGSRAVVTPSLSKQMANGEPLAPPKIVSVPVVWQGGSLGGVQGGVSFPLSAGDEVLLVFSQRSLEEYLQGSDEAPSDPHRFDLTDAIAIPKLGRSGSAPTDRAVFTFGAAKLEMMPDGSIFFGNAAGGLTLTAGGQWEFTGAGLRTDIDVVISGVKHNTHKHITPSGISQEPING